MAKSSLQRATYDQKQKFGDMMTNNKHQTTHNQYDANSLRSISNELAGRSNLKLDEGSEKNSNALSISKK